MAVKTETVVASNAEAKMVTPPVRPTTAAGNVEQKQETITAKDADTKAQNDKIQIEADDSFVVTPDYIQQSMNYNLQTTLNSI